MINDRLSGHLFRQLLENIDVGIMVDDSTGRIYYANGAFLKMFGLSREQLEFFDFSELTAPEHRNDLLKLHLHRLAGKPVPGQVDFTGMRTDGRRIRLQASVSMLQEEEKVFFLTILRDFTGEVVATTSMEQHNRAIMAGRMCRDILHSLQEQLGSRSYKGGIPGALKWADSQIQPPENGAGSLIDAGLLVLETAGYIEEKAHNTIKVTVSVEPDIPEVQVPTLLVGQLLRNLADNSLEAVGENRGHIKLVAGRTEVPREKGSEGVAIEVRDNGPGMHRNVLERVGEPFFTTKNRRTHRGLGLYQVFTGMSIIGGSALVNSSGDLGTRVNLRFPAAT